MKSTSRRRNNVYASSRTTSSFDVLDDDVLDDVVLDDDVLGDVEYILHSNLDFAAAN